jgi:hypothetical protein
MSRKDMKQQNKADWASPDLFKAGEDQTSGSGPSPLSDEDKRRLFREWTDANTRGDDEARQRVEAEILGHVPPTSSPNVSSKADHRPLTPGSNPDVSTAHHSPRKGDKA